MSTEQSTWQHTPDPTALAQLAERLATLRTVVRGAELELTEGNARACTQCLALVDSRLATEALAALVALRRADGSTWRDVADDLSVTPQAAQQRYGRTR